MNNGGKKSKEQLTTRVITFTDFDLMIAFVWKIKFPVFKNKPDIFTALYLQYLLTMVSLKFVI